MRKRGLLLRFGIIFSVFALVVLIISGILIYFNRINTLLKEREEGMQYVTRYLTDVIRVDGEEFARYQDYFMEHSQDILIPYDFDDPDEAAVAYETMFAKEFPGKILGVDVDFDDFSDELKNSYAVYNHEYYLNLFERARDDFNIDNIYYAVPTGEPYVVCYMYDTNRKEKTGKDGEHYLRIEDHVKESPDTHPKLWEAWDTGEVPQGYDTIDEVPRNTYVFYAPLVTDGRKLGVIGTEISIGALNYPILQTTLRQLLVIAIVLIVVVAILLWFIDRFYIKRLERINDSIRIYSKDKNARIAGEIDKNDTGNDEISSLANQTAAMISEIDTYMTDLVKNAKEENGNSEQTAAMNELAIRDSLTGIRNKAAYDKEIKSLEWGLDSGEKKFGIAIVDMNSLGAINEAGGREKGDIAIRRLCRSVCVTFAHSPVFRTDGDEFAIILRDNDYNMIEELTEKLYADIGQGLNGRDADKHEGFTAALGYALFDEDKDNSVDDVIRRAYEAMNERKAVMKQL